MNHMIKKLSAVLIAGILLFGTVAGAVTPAAAAEGFSVAFADPYAKVGQPINLQVENASANVTYSWTVDGKSVGQDAAYTPTESDLMKWIAVTVTSGSETWPFSLRVTQVNAPRGTGVAMVGIRASCQPMPVLIMVAPAASMACASSTVSAKVPPPSTRSSIDNR